MATALIIFLTGVFRGTSALGMIVTLSPSGANGWETWFSLQYGADLARLHAPRRRERLLDADKLHKATLKDAAALQKAADATAKDHRYYAQKKHMATAAAERLRRLELLLGAAETSGRGGPPGGGDGDGA